MRWFTLSSTVVFEDECQMMRFAAWEWMVADMIEHYLPSRSVAGRIMSDMILYGSAIYDPKIDL